MAASSVPASSASAPASPAAADLASLRAAPARPLETSGVATQASGARAPAQPDGDRRRGSSENAPTRGAPAAVAALPASAATPAAGAGSSFGETLAASMSASAAPAQGATATPAKAVRGKPADARDVKDPKAAEVQSAAVASLAVQPLIAGGLVAQGSSQGSPAGAAAAGTDSSSDATPADAGSAPAAVTGLSGGHASVAPAIAAALTASRQPAAPRAGEPATPEEDADTSVAAPDSGGGGSAAPASAPFHTALQSALPAIARLDGVPQLPAASQPPGTSNDLASANAALSAAAAPGATAHGGPSAAPQPGAPVTAQVHAEVGSSGWANELGTRLHWMANAGIGSASLRLTPEQLGPVEVKISVHQNAASVWFSASQPDTRTALELALPRLRELFSAQGLNLAQAGVSDQSARSAPGERHAPAVNPRTSAARELSATLVTPAVRTHQGLIDTYA